MSAWQAFQWTLRSVFFDKGAVIPAVAGILLYFVFYPLPYGPEVVRAVPVVVADYDASPLSRQMARDLDATQEVRVEGVSRSVEDAVPRLQRGEIGGIVVVPQDFYRDVLRGTPTGVTVMGNGGYIVVDGKVLKTTLEVVAETTAPALAAQLVRSNVPPAAVMRLERSGPLYVKQPLFNTVQGYASYVVPASMGLIVHQLLIIAICIVIGTWVEGDAGRSLRTDDFRWERLPGCWVDSGCWCLQRCCSGSASCFGTTIFRGPPTCPGRSCSARCMRWQ